MGRMGRVRARGSAEFRPAGLDVVDVSLGDTDLVILSYRLPPPPPVFASLSPSQRHVLQLLLDGRSNAEIARTRKTAPGTVAKQIDAVYRRLGVQSRRELVSLISKRR
jgi:DNA-binding NarL/FixJ family response regulator